MKYGRNQTISILPVVRSLVVPVGPVGVARSKWALGRRGGSRKERGRTRAHRTFPMLVQLPDIQPDVVDRGVDLGTPLLKGCGHTLDGGDARLLRDGEVAESALPLVVLLGDTSDETRSEIRDRRNAWSTRRG